MPTPTTHALLAASAAARWLNCPPSARLCEDLPDTTSEYAAEGTLAHAFCEAIAQRQFCGMTIRKFNGIYKKLKEDPLYKPEMLDTAQTYVDFLRESEMAFAVKPVIALEKSVDYSHYAPEGRGTADCIMLGGDTLQITDYKHGSSPNGRVDPEHNPQLSLYALGALDYYAPIYGDGIQRVILAVVQPRLDNVTKWQTTVAELRAWGEEYVKPRAQLAWDGQGDFAPGDHCKYCKIKATCRARSSSYSALEEFKGALPPTLSDAEVGNILQRAIALKAWVADLEKYALAACLDGKEIPGWKAVEGLSRREIADPDAVAAKLQAAGYDPAVLFVRKLETLGNLETLVGKKNLPGILGDLLVKPQGKPALVAASDKRPPFNGAAADFAEVT